MAASMIRSTRSCFVQTGHILKGCSVIRSTSTNRRICSQIAAQLKRYSGLSVCGEVYQNNGKLRATFGAKPTDIIRCLSTQAAEEKPTEEKLSSDDSEAYHTIIKNKERARGPVDKREFQAETRKLLDIVAKSLYSEKEVFIRELISNGSDALEKLRYLQTVGGEIITEKDRPLEIHLAVDEEKKTFTIQDTGVGMTKEEIIDNLGIIARSGSKAFIDAAANKGVDKNIIGQFGVGFYSTFMVGDKVDVYTRSYKPDSPAYKWQSDGMGSYELCEAENVERGTKIVIHLRGDCYNFAKEDVIKDVVKKYSNFVGVPIFLNGKKINVIQALWTLEPRDISDDQHEEFYRFISNTFDKPRYYLHYKTDAPLNIRALFYIPDYKPTMFDMSRETDVSVTLYSRKVMIVPKANHVLPRWLRFVRGANLNISEIEVEFETLLVNIASMMGAYLRALYHKMCVVDSEDIPLNLSRELLQDSGLIRKLRWVLTNRLIKFFLEQSKKDKDKYLQFYDSYGLFIREGIVTTPEQEQREEIAKLMRFESSKLAPGERTSLDDYVGRMKAGTRNIFYLSAPNRHLAETSAYMEAMQQRDIEVLYCFENYDELVLMNLGQFDKKNLKSIENELVEEKPDPASTSVDPNNAESLTQEQADDLLAWLQAVLGPRVAKTKITKRLVSHPCVITVNEMGAARHFIKTALADRSEEEKFRVLQPTLEINVTHPIIRKLYTLKLTNSELARLIAEQVYDNSMIAAGLIDDPRNMLGRLNTILAQALEKH